MICVKVGLHCLCSDILACFTRRIALLSVDLHLFCLYEVDWYDLKCTVLDELFFFTVVFSLSQFCLYFCWYSNSARELYLYYLNRQKRERKNVFIMDDILTRDFRETCYIKYLLAMMYDSKTLASTHYGINYWFSNATITDRLVL